MRASARSRGPIHPPRRFIAEVPTRVRVVVLIAAVLNVLMVVGMHAHLAAVRHGGPALLLHWRWHADVDKSFAELLGSAQLFAAAVVLLMLTMQRRGGYVYLGWALLFLVMVVDDLGRVHETGSRLLRAAYHLPALPGLRPDDTGELITWAALGVVPMVVLIVLHRRATQADRADSWGFAALFALLLVFAIGVDMLHIVIRPLGGPNLALAMVTIETFGEIMASSLIFGYALALAVRPVSSSASECPGGHEAAHRREHEQAHSDVSAPQAVR